MSSYTFKVVETVPGKGKHMAIIVSVIIAISHWTLLHLGYPLPTMGMSGCLEEKIFLSKKIQFLPSRSGESTRKRNAGSCVGFLAHGGVQAKHDGGLNLHQTQKSPSHPGMCTARWLTHGKG